MTHLPQLVVIAILAGVGGPASADTLTRTAEGDR